MVKVAAADAAVRAVAKVAAADAEAKAAAVDVVVKAVALVVVADVKVDKAVLPRFTGQMFLRMPMTS